MATTFVEYTGDGQASKQFTFPSYQESDVKVRVDGVLKTTSTHYNITNYTTTGGGNVVFTSGNIPSSPAKIRIYRDTSVDVAKATYTAGSSVKAADLNNNNTQLLYRAQEEQVPNLIQSYDVAASAIETSNIKDANVTTAKIADDAVTMAKLGSGNLPSDINIQTANLVNANVTTAKLADSSVTTAKLADSNVTTAKIADDAVTQDKLADNSVGADQIIASSITVSELNAAAVTTAKINDAAITEAKIADNAVTTSKLPFGAITSGRLANNSVITGKINNSAVTQIKLADNSVGTPELINGSVTTDKIASDAVTNAKIADNSIDSEHYVDGSIDHVHLANDIIDGDNIQDNAINSEHYVDGSIDRVHLEADIIDSTKLADNAVGTEHIQTNSVTANEILGGTLDGRYFTETELLNGALDGRYFTETEADARYFNISTGDTIKDGDTFPDNDTTIATTAAINDRIIDLVDDVGGFVPIANETSFPTANPDVNNGSGTLVSIKAISSTRTPSSGTVTIANGAGSGNTVTITGCGSTVLTAGFGVIVETTSTLHTYAFHRLVPKATEVTTVAGISSNVTTVATNIADINTVAADLNEGTSEIDTVATNIANVNTVGNAIANVNTTAGSIANVNTTAGSITNVNNVGNNISNVNSVAGNESNINSAVSNASNINSAVSNASNINTVAGSISNVNTTAGSISNVNTVASNISNVNSFFNVYRIGANNPTTSLDTGDLFFNTTSNSLKVYTGSAWVDGVTTTGDFALKTGNTFTGSNRYNDNVKAEFGASADLQIFHDGTDSVLLSGVGSAKLRFRADNQIFKNNANSENLANFLANGAVNLYYDSGIKFSTTSYGALVSGTLLATGNIKTGTDTGKLAVGASDDLQIYHDGSHSRIKDAGTGNLNIQANVAAIQNAAGTENCAVFNQNGNVELYSDNVKVFETSGNGISVKGPEGGYAQITLSADENDDNADKFKFYVEDQGPLQIQNRAQGVWETNIECNGNGNVELFFNNAKKLETTSTGVQVSGELLIEGDTKRLIIKDTAGTGNVARPGVLMKDSAASNQFFIGNGSVSDTDLIITNYTNADIELKTNNTERLTVTSDGHVEIPADGKKLKIGAGQDLQLYHNGTHSFLENSTGGVYVRSDEVLLQSNTGNENYIVATLNGAVELYHNNIKQTETNANGLVFADDKRLTFGDSNDAFFKHNSTNNTFELAVNNAQPYKILVGGETGLQITPNTSVDLYYNNSKKLETTSTGVTVTGKLTATDEIITQDDLRIQSTYPRLYLTDTDSNDDFSLINNNGNFLIYNDTQNAFRLKIDGTTSHFATNLRPTADSTFDIGTNTLRWANVYADTYYGDGSNLTGINTDLVADTSPQLGGTLDVNGQVVSFDDATGVNVNRAKFGTGNDLHIYHNGNDSVVRHEGTGDLLLNSVTGLVKITNGSENMLRATRNGAVELYYDNGRQLETRSNGIGLDNNLFLADQKVFYIGNHLDLQIYHDGSNSYIKDGGTGSLVLQASTLAVNNSAGNEQMLKAVEDGAVELNHNGNKRFETRDDGCKITGNATDGRLIISSAGDVDLFLQADTDNSDETHNPTIHFQQDGGGTNMKIGVEGSAGTTLTSTTGNSPYVASTQGVPLQFGTDSVIRWEIGSGGHLEPMADNTYDIGSSSSRVRNMYTGDLHMSNEGSSNDVDGTWGDWTIQEGESDLFLKNNRSGKKYKFNLMEVS